MNLAACDNGEAYAWPYQKGTTTFSLPVKMPFSEKIKIQRVACGQNFGLFLSNQGLVYSVGKDNSEGQLGLGHVYPRDVPELISALREVGERIDQIECGFKHVVVKSTLGKVYTWGWGASGQLGQGHFDSEISPRLLHIEKGKQREKAVQIACGYSHSLVMVEPSREVFIFGTSGTVSQQARPQPLPQSEVMPDLFPNMHILNPLLGGQQVYDYAVVKINSSWSKSMSISTVVLADLRAVNTIYPMQKVQNAVLTLAQKWDPKDVNPPYIETIAGMFSGNVMKMSGQSGQPKPKKTKGK